jgi:hypothetical protein
MLASFFFLKSKFHRLVLNLSLGPFPALRTK